MRLNVQQQFILIIIIIIITHDRPDPDKKYTEYEVDYNKTSLHVNPTG